MLPFSSLVEVPHLVNVRGLRPCRVLSSVDTSPVSASHSSVDANCNRSVRESPHRSATVVIFVGVTGSSPSHSIYTHPLLRLSSWLLLAVVCHESHGNTLSIELWSLVLVLIGSGTPAIDAIFAIDALCR
jgi:hypothetical protein